MQIIRLPVGMLQANCYLVAEAGGDAVVIDPGAEAEAILAKARESAKREQEELVSSASKELVDMAVTAAEKIALGADGDPYEQFLNLAERRTSHEQSR